VHEVLDELLQWMVCRKGMDAHRCWRLTEARPVLDLSGQHVAQVAKRQFALGVVGMDRHHQQLVAEHELLQPSLTVPLGERSRHEREIRLFGGYRQGGATIGIGAQPQRLASQVGQL
jgi:hypothetical protein